MPSNRGNDRDESEKQRIEREVKDSFRRAAVRNEFRDDLKEIISLSKSGRLEPSDLVAFQAHYKNEDEVSLLTKQIVDEGHGDLRLNTDGLKSVVNRFKEIDKLDIEAKKDWDRYDI